MAERTKFGRIAVSVLELDIDKCANTYGVAPCTATGAPGSECYNTFKTCQDKPNFVKTTKTYKFASRGAPIPAGELHRPYITSVRDAPTVIEPEAGLARRAVVTLNMVDETDADVDTDLYVRNRATPAQGTFWARLLARSPNYVGRFARLRRGYAVTPWDWNEFVTELYVIDQIKGPDRSGAVQVILKDPVKLADRTKVPAPTSGKLAVALALNDTQLELDALSGAQYTANGYVRRGDEIIRYTHKHVENGWNFSDGIDEGFTVTNATITTGTDVITLTATAADPQLRKGSLSLAGGTWRYLAVRMRQLVAGTWDGKVYYTTSGHGESASFYAQATEPALLTAGGWVTVVWDMHNLAAGGNDWIDSTITGIRFDLASTSGASYEIDWISHSTTDQVEADLLVWPDGTYRAQFGTSAQAGKVGDGVQLCKVYTDASVSAVVQDLLNASGLDNAYIDLAQLTAEDATWLGDKSLITVCLSEPEDVSVYLAEICKATGAVMWWLPTEQKAKFKVIGPRSPTETVGQALDDAANLIDGTVAITTLDDLRITLAGIYYDLVSATANRRENKNYLKGELYEDADAESANEYNDQRMRVETTRWFGAANSSAIKSRVNRLLAYYRDAPKQIDFAVDPKDGDRAVGDLVPLTTAGITDFAGAPDVQKVLITKRTDNDDGRIQYSARTTVFNRRYAFVAPAGHPDYLVATEDERAYAFICNSSGKMSNGDDGYLII